MARGAGERGRQLAPYRVDVLFEPRVGRGAHGAGWKPESSALADASAGGADVASTGAAGRARTACVGVVDAALLVRLTGVAATVLDVAVVEACFVASGFFA